jgi:hypothetical protein
MSPLAHLRKVQFEQNESAFGATSSVAIACSTTTDEPVGNVAYLHKPAVGEDDPASGSASKEPM